MIKISHVSKSFDGFQAVNDISLQIEEGNVFGLIGTNGAGKSTLLRMIAGVYKPEAGTITVDDLPVFDNEQAKSLMFYISDDMYFFANANAEEMVTYYDRMYMNYDKDQFFKYLDIFGLERRRKIRNYSKGMKKQLAILLGLCSHTKYLFCDETFDGLDPVMRQTVKTMMIEQMEEGLTPVIASHNLRELEDICDHVGLLHKGGVLLSKDLEQMKCGVCKVQCAFNDEEKLKKALESLKVRTDEKRGALHTLLIEGDRNEVEMKLREAEPVFIEVLNLSLEELFINETEVAGYDIRKLISD